MNDYGAKVPLWISDLDLTDQIISQISSALLGDLKCWSETFQKYYSYESGTWERPELSKSEYKHGVELAIRVKQELGQDFVVKYVPWEHRKRIKVIR
jgi:hypothetical protein